MVIPLNKIVDLQDDVYACTCAIIKRAQQVTVAGDEEVDKNNGKVVTVAIDQILSAKVEYEIEE
ncbi:MAG: DNA-directed RNA polymerase subunit omega [Spirochaetales bacterium]|nr:DNA-directed RNA polymerase subunit omega [Spirochaetales bacterium]